MIYVFDVDNTLTPPREAMRTEFALQLMEFCRANTVYLVSGSDRGKLDKQLPEEVLLASAGVFTSAGSEFEVKGRTIYQHNHEFPDELIDWLDRELHNSRYPVHCGRHIEYRTGALNVSTVGRAADKPTGKAYLA
jgi:phosphomannomutase